MSVRVRTEAAEAAAIAAERRVILDGVSAWRSIGKAQSFDSWKSIGAALAIGKQHALRASGSDIAWGRSYSLQFNKWLTAHGFANMVKSTRSHAIQMFENIAEIERWRGTLPEKQQRRLCGPQQNVRRWRKETRGEAPPDLHRQGRAAWRRLCSIMRSLPEAEAVILWHTLWDDAASWPG